MDYTYNKNHQLIGVTGYAPDGSVFGKLLVRNYDKKGNVIESYREMIAGGESTIRDRKTMKYDKKGRKIELTQYRREIPWSFINTSMIKEGNRIEESHAGADGVVYERLVQTYDEDGNKIQELIYRGEDGYDNKMTFEYDDHRNLIREVQLIGSGEVIQTISYDYTYDNTGNWVKKVRLLDGDGMQKIERSYEYDQCQLF